MDRKICQNQVPITAILFSQLNVYCFSRGDHAHAFTILDTLPISQSLRTLASLRSVNLSVLSYSGLLFYAFYQPNESVRRGLATSVIPQRYLDPRWTSFLFPQFTSEAHFHGSLLSNFLSSLKWLRECRQVPRSSSFPC